MATVTLHTIVRDDVVPLIRLKVRLDQLSFIAPNAVTLAQAPYETGTYPLAVRAGDDLVGFCALIDNTEHEFLDEGDDPDACFLWRFMIGQDFQGRGYGKTALQCIADWAAARRLSRVVTTVVAQNTNARRLYAASGFEETGRVWDGEIEMVWRYEL